MAQVIKNPYYLAAEHQATERPSRSTRCCLSLKPTCNALVRISVFSLALALIFVMFTKTTAQCLPQTPYPLCVANRHCAYLTKSSHSYLDLVPFMGDANMCVKRSEYNEFLYKGISSTLNLVNWLQPEAKEEQQDHGILSKAKELMLGTEKERKKLVSAVSYYYDEELFLHITRYELGVWLLFLMMYGLRKALEKCGQRKTVFDFMGKGQRLGVVQGDGSVREVSKEGIEEMRRAREQALKKKNK